MASYNLFEHSSIKVRNFKCFGGREQGFEKIRPINLIIGRNNSGKSSLLELVEYVTTGSPNVSALGHRGNNPEIFLSQPLQENELKSVFPENGTGGTIAGDHWQYGKSWVNKNITYKLEQDRSHSFVSLDPPFSHRHPERDQQELAKRTPNPFMGKIFKRLRSERDIVVESANAPPDMNENGIGATRIVAQFINFRTFPSELVEVTLLSALNGVYHPDSQFTKISVQQEPGKDQWEIYLFEQTSEAGSNPLRLPLSQTGSGFKTILLALMLIYLVPFIEKRDVAEYVFAFEELENNLHPALQRRLLGFLREFAVKTGCTLFITTHSNVIIDLFSHDDQAQILHVSHAGDESVVGTVDTYMKNKDVLDDLDVRASDLLQSNSVVWVEGPSDRIYFNRWIQLWSNGMLREGIHYQCMFYGGSLLSRLSMADPTQSTDEVITLLGLNKNAIVLMDSDKENKDSEPSGTKSRITKELTEMSGYAWITAGREIENYLPTKVIEEYLGKQAANVLNMYDDIAIFLDRHVEEGKGRWFERNKPMFATEICPLLTKDRLIGQMDLDYRMLQVCAKIKEWNKID
jgi:putative ATP-dependent endonuclease of the OLD family